MAAKKKNFEESVSRLKEIVAVLEKGETGLDEAMSLFTEGTELVSSCNRMLDEARQKVTALHFTESGVQESDFTTT